MEDRHSTLSRKIFVIANYTFCILVALICIFPMFHILALSFSSPTAVNAGEVLLLPIEFNLRAYSNVMENTQFLVSTWITLKRVALGIIINMSMTILAAYPLSKTRARFAGRQFYVWFFVVTMLFNAGLIPTYLVVTGTGLTNTLWALVLPGAVPIFNIILMQNFIKALPEEISESAFVDGAGHWRTLWSIVIPLCRPSMAAILLFVIVAHWNDWFGGLLYMNNPKLYPLQTYLRTQIVVDPEVFSNTAEDLAARTAESSNRAAQMFLAMIPVLILYPFIQKHFTKGIVMGSVKG